jgi:hypothetical protein
MIAEAVSTTAATANVSRRWRRVGGIVAREKLDGTDVTRAGM